MVPMLHKSTLASYDFDNNTSGAIYSGDPHSVWAMPSPVNSRANPKSAKVTKCFTIYAGYLEVTIENKNLQWGY